MRQHTGNCKCIVCFPLKGTHVHGRNYLIQNHQRFGLIDSFITSLREFVLRTVILAPGACRSQGRSRPGWLHFRKWMPSMPSMPWGIEFQEHHLGLWKSWSRNFRVGKWWPKLKHIWFPRPILGKSWNTRFCTSSNFDLQGRIYLKVETRLL